MISGSQEYILKIENSGVADVEVDLNLSIDGVYPWSFWEKPYRKFDRWVFPVVFCTSFFIVTFLFLLSITWICHRRRICTCLKFWVPDQFDSNDEDANLVNQSGADNDLVIANGNANNKIGIASDSLSDSLDSQSLQSYSDNK